VKSQQVFKPYWLFKSSLLIGLATSFLRRAEKFFIAVKVILPIF